MKILAAFLLTICLATSAAAAPYPVRAVEKLGTGLVNLLTVPVEPFIGAYHTAATFDRWGAPDPIGAVLGFIMGIGGSIGHIFQSVSDIVTFPVAPPDIERRLYLTVFDYSELDK